MRNNFIFKDYVKKSISKDLEFIKIKLAYELSLKINSKRTVK